MPNGKGYIQARDLRNATAAEALAMLAETPPQEPQERQRRAMAVTSLVKAWEAACERMRIVRGVPLPGSRRPSSKPQRPARRSSGLVAPPAQTGLVEQPKPADQQPG